MHAKEFPALQIYWKLRNKMDRGSQTAVDQTPYVFRCVSAETYKNKSSNSVKSKPKYILVSIKK